MHPLTLLDLTDDALSHILSFCSRVDLVALNCTALRRRLRGICFEKLWRRACEEADCAGFREDGDSWEKAFKRFIHFCLSLRLHAMPASVEVKR